MKEAVDKKDSGRVEYRPCIVQNEKGRGCEYKKALFHCWDFRSELYGASPLIGGHSAGQVSGTFGIVEYEDGTVHEVLPTQIRFVDREIKNYAFCVDEKELKEDGKQSSCDNS